MGHNYNPENKRAYSRTYYAANREKLLAQKRAAYAANREERNALGRAHYAANKERLNAQLRSRRSTRREEFLAYGRAYRAANREEMLAKSRAYSAANRETIKHNHLKRKYGLTLGEFRGLLSQQGGVCAICGTAKWNKQGPIVDHNHKTGKVRGIICVSCNLGLGIFRDDPRRLRNAFKYLERGGTV